MIKIEKLKEPGCLTEYRKQEYALYDGLSSDLKNQILDSLMKEQGYLCAYCMRRISHEKGATIEHIIPQSKDPSKALNYSNMLAVCDGNAGKGALICDKSRGNKDITVNPLKEKTLSSIKYKNGVILSDDKIINTDLNETLNLNAKELSFVANRINALEQFKLRLKKEKSTGLFTSKTIDKYIKKYSGFNSKGQKYEYCGIILDWLNKHNR